MKREIKTSTGLIAVFGVAVILFGAAITYYYQMAPTTYDYGVYDFAVVTKTATNDATKDWKTYESPDYGLAFKYPKGWITPEPTINKKNDPGIVDSLFLDFNGKDGSKELRYYVELSKLEDYAPSQKGVVALKKVFSDQKAGDEIAWLPPGNAMMISYSKPIYVSTADKKFRGITFFANTGQDINYGIDCFSVLTDGTNVFQLHVMDSGSAKGKEFSNQNKSIDNQSVQAEYANYIKGLTLKSTTEPIVADYNSIYSLISKSLISVDPTANWQVYRNATFGFNFKYPNGYSLEDNLQKNKSKTDVTVHDGLFLTSTANSNQKLSFYINPSGWGYENYSKEISNTTVQIDRSTEAKKSVSEDPESNIRAATASFKKGADDYFVMLTYSNTVNLEPVLDLILNSIDFD